MTHPNDNHSPRPVIREVSPEIELNLATESSALSASERSESVSEIPISNSLWEETALVNVSISKGGLKCQRVMLSDMHNWGGVIRRYTGCTLQTFVKHYDSICPPFFRDSHFS